MVQAWNVGLLLYLLNDCEKWDLKLCMYKIPFGKSGHICIYVCMYIQPSCKLTSSHVYLHLTGTCAWKTVSNRGGLVKESCNTQSTYMLVYMVLQYDYQLVNFSHTCKSCHDYNFYIYMYVSSLQEFIIILLFWCLISIFLFYYNMMVATYVCCSK